MMRIRTSTTIAALVLLALPASAQALTKTVEGTASEVPGSAYKWTNPAYASGQASKQAEVTLPPEQSANTLKVLTPVGVPSNVTVTGVEARVSYNCDCEIDLTAQLSKAGVPWGSPSTAHIVDLNIGKWETERYLNLGAPTAAEVNSGTFGLTLGLKKDTGASPIWIRQATIVVTYSLPPRLWSENHVQIGEAPLSVLVWGSPTLSSGAGQWTCETVGIAHVSNLPTGGIGGIGAYETPFCSAPTCEAEGKKGFVTPNGEVNWQTILPEAVEPIVQINGISLQVGCIGGTSQIFSGSLFPHIEQGSSIGASPARLQFATSGELSGGAKVEGNLKMMGFEAGEILGAK